LGGRGIESFNLRVYLATIPYIQVLSGVITVKKKAYLSKISLLGMEGSQLFVAGLLSLNLVGGIILANPKK